MSEQTIYRALCPRVVVLSSPDVAAISKDNGCEDFAQMLRPFEAQIQNITVRTSQLAARPCSTFPLRIDQLSSFEDGTNSEINRHPEEVLDAVTAHISTHARRWDADVPRIEVKERADVRPEHLQTPVEQLAPWFADFRDLILGHRAVSEHETFGHPVAMLLAVSSMCADPMKAFAQLHEQSQQPTAYTQRPYMHLDVLRYYLILHDVSRSGKDLERSKELLDNVRTTYGLNCCILAINSAGEGTPKSEGFSTMWSRALQRDPRAPLLRPNIATPEPRSPGTGGGLGVPEEPSRWSTPTPESQDDRQQAGTAPATSDSPTTQNMDEDNAQHTFGAALNDEDVRRLKAFMREFVAQSLVPHMEKCVQVWNEQVAASRRGITSKLFGAGRRMFGAARTAPATQPPGFDAHRQIYPAAAIEALTRRLADFAFMTRDLKLAASLYEMVRKDFVSDKAWKYAAGASEMLGLCQLLQASANATASSAEAEALLGQACHEFSLGNHTQLSAIRASLLFYEAQRSIRDWRNVEPVLIRAAGFAEEISSAIFLEQAALANLRQPKAALRKFAVRLVMAGHRYNDCGQRYLSLRCYAQAATFYRAKDWCLVANHIEHELGKQAYLEGNADQAAQHLLRVIRPNEGSTVTAETYIDELLSAFKYSGSKEATAKPAEFAFEVFPSQDCFFDNGTAGGSIERDEEWTRMEEQFLRTGFGSGSSGPGGKARKRPLQLTSASQDVIVGMNETLFLQLTVRNPLSADLELSEIRPDIMEEGVDDGSDADALGLRVDQTDSIRIPAHQSCTIRLRVAAAKIGRYRVRGVSFTVANTIPFFQIFNKKGARLYATKEHKTTPSYAADRTLVVRVRESRPQLTVELVEPPESLHHGEEAQMTARLINVGHDDMYDIRFLTSDTSCLSLKRPNDSYDAGADTLELSDSLTEDAPVEIALPSLKLGKGESVEVVLRVRASSTGPLALRGLLVYQNEANEVFSARIQHSVHVLPSLLITSDCTWLSDDQPKTLLDLHIGNVSAELQGLGIAGITAITTDKRVHFPSDLSLDGLRSSIDSSSALRFPITLGIEVNAEEDNVLLVKQLRSLLGRKKDDKAMPLTAYPPKSVHIQQLQIHSSEAIAQSPFLGAVRKAWRLHTLSSEFSAVSELDRRRVFPLFDVSELDLIIHWEQSKSDDPSSPRRYGSIPLFGIRLGPLRNRLETLTDGGKNIRSLYAETAKEQAAVLNNLLTSSLGVTENPVMITLLAEGIVAHDFERGAARVPVSFKLRNLSDRQRASFRLTLLQSEEDADAPLAIAPWVGRASFRGSLEAGASRVVTASMLVESPSIVSSGLWSGEIRVEGGISGSGSSFVIAGTDRVFVNMQQSST
ncbi:hypothetical protein A4X09_0g1379 [Tilletia walkeri]|uniref:TPPC8 first Ig-like domain-containing protein n=1 Tax=Tilletia walkeri TaxID=117179 RepID=A0A8X7T6P7_9BASI|nr:hypothetical protein A4X09_0g1379 [Tilletia walkeri]